MTTIPNRVLSEADVIPAVFATAAGAEVVTSRALATLAPSAVWITWERQRRNAGVAGALGVPLYECNLKYGGLKRYAVSLAKTFWLLRGRRPEGVFVQKPSIVLALAAIAYCAVFGATVVVDAHNSALIPLAPSAPPLLRALYRFAVRHADFTIVSNERLEALVAAQGGSGLVLPDSIPQLPPPADAP